MMINGADVSKIMRTPTELALLIYQTARERRHFMETELKFRAPLVNPENDDARNEFNILLSEYWDILDPGRKDERVSFADKMENFEKTFKDKPIVLKK